MPVDLLVLGTRPEERLEDADPRALERVGGQAGAKGRGPPAPPSRGDGVRGVLSHGRIQHEGQVRDAAREGSADVLRMGERDDAGAARQPGGSAQAEQVGIRRRNADRAAGVAGHAGHRKARRHGHGRASARSTWRPRRIVGIARLATERADGDDAGRQLVQIGLAEDHRARLPQLRHLERVATRREAGQRHGSTRGRQVSRLVVVLDDDRDPVQRPAGAPLPSLPVERIGLVERPRVEGDHGVQRRSLLVVGGHAGEVRGGNRPRRRTARGHVPLQVLDRSLDDLQAGAAAGRGRGGGSRLRLGDQTHGHGETSSPRRGGRHPASPAGASSLARHGLRPSSGSACCEASSG